MENSVECPQFTVGYFIILYRASILLKEFNDLIGI
jgi:hypothetical protein